MAKPEQAGMWLQQRFLRNPYRVHGLLFIIFIAQGFIYCSPPEIAQGIMRILLSPDILVVDYIAVGGLGAALVNVGLVGLLSISVFLAAKREPNGLTMGTLGLTTGFAFFGKNPFNMLPIIFGAYLYSVNCKKPFKEAVFPALLGTCLAPTVSTLATLYLLPVAPAIIIGVLIGVGIGFLMPPLAAAMVKTHEGTNLYNVGFTAGLIGLCLYALFLLLGLDFPLLAIWSSGNNLELGLCLAILSLYLIICGVLGSRQRLSLRKIVFIDANDNDFFLAHFEQAYINMGILGLTCLLIMIVVGGEFSGPVLGSIVSVVGFGAYGKSLPSSLPIIAGCLIASLASMATLGTPFNSRGFLVATFFSTCLSPLAKRFGVRWGLLAGFLHLTLAANVATFHGGMNLYNNGFAGGLTAMMLLPIMKFLKSNENPQ